MATLKGQYFRVFLGGTLVAQATNCVITMQTSQEDQSTKDDYTQFAKPGIQSKSWQVQVESLDVSDVGTLLTAIKNGTAFAVSFDRILVRDHRPPEAAGHTDGGGGQALLTDASFTWNDREFASKNITFTGTGVLNFNSTIPSINS